MSTDSQSLSLPLKNLLQGMAEQAPVKLLQSLSLFAGRAVNEAELLTFVAHAQPNDPGVIQLRLALAKWDADEDLKLDDPEGNETGSGTIARRVAVVRALGLSAAAETTLREAIPVHEEDVIVISKDFEPWYDEARKTRSSLYWDDYKKYLTDVRKWPESAITILDQSTHSVVERLTDPTRPKIKKTKGLVVGYVQSGKTANFTGVIAKAIDVGYRLVIVMTGTVEILRSQTQRRIDMELMGVENVLAGQDQTDPEVVKGLDYQQDEAWPGDFVRHGQLALEQPGVVRIRRVTTHHGDYKSLPHGISQLQYHRVDKSKPLNAAENLFHTDAYVVIIKKNRAPLTKLIKDLKPLQNMLKDLPALIIDDESDIASINTKDPKKSNERTAINKLITEIMNIVPRTQYVGYTATPFANVFIDPDDDSNIFPSNFVLSLPRPAEYMGVQEFHDVDSDWEDVRKTVVTSNELAYVRAIHGDPDTEPGRHCEELKSALDAWVISGAIKKYRESGKNIKTGNSSVYRHHTMLVHESVKNADQAESARLVRTLWSQGKFTSGEGLDRLRKLFDSDYKPVMDARENGAAIPATFDELKPFVATAFEEMTSGGTDPVLIVNSDKEIESQQEALDFDAKKVWRVLVGGTKLSRGFTIEGLTISFYRRKAGQADTLMQAGRWFGFRQGYQDLVRLYIRRDPRNDLYEAFEALLLDEEAFRDELGKYQGLDENGKPLIEPRQIPPLVTQHLPWLKPTARNKMFNAVLASKARVGAFHQMSSIPPRAEKAKHRHNLEAAVLPMLRVATRDVTLPYIDGGEKKTQKAKVGLMPGKEFLDLFDELYWHPDYAKVVGPLRKFIGAATDAGRIRDWAIVWPQRQTRGRTFKFNELGVEAPIFQRSRRGAPRIDFTGENKRNVLAADPVAEGRNVPGLGESVTRGVVVVSLVADVEEKDESNNVDRADIVGLLSIRIPDKSIRNRSDLIQWTVKVGDKPDYVVVDDPDAAKRVRRSPHLPPTR